MNELLLKKIEMFKTNAVMFKQADIGTIGIQELGQYFYNLISLFSDTDSEIENAILKAELDGYYAISKILKERMTLDAQNSLFSIKDLSKLDLIGIQTENLRIYSETEKLNSWVNSQAKTSPITYLIHRLFVRGLALTLAPKWIESIQLNCGVGINQILILEKYKAIDEGCSTQIDLLSEEILNLISFTEVSNAINQSYDLLLSFHNAIFSNDEKIKNKIEQSSNI